MRFFFALLVLMVLPVFPAAAQDMLRDHRAQDPVAKLLDKDGGAPQTINEYANLYYESCVAGADKGTELEEYNITQCGCAAAKLPEFMTLKNMKALFINSQEGDFQQGRVLMLAYMPCMYDTIDQFVYDGCYYSEEMRKNMIRPSEVCKCYGHNMAEYVASKGEAFVPGLTDDGYDREKAVSDPLGHIIGNSVFNSRSKYEFERCVMEESYNWK
ncbi:MAG: hypothetical protein WBK55_03560 [Alphaproteobacteria bacterium]